MLDNSENVNAFKGAGIQAATMVCDKGVDAMLTGFCGPNAFKVLNAAGVKVAAAMLRVLSERRLMLSMQEKSLLRMRANVEGHW